MTIRTGFTEESTAVIAKALEFVGKKIQKYYKEKKYKVDQIHHAGLDSDRIRLEKFLEGVDQLITENSGQKLYEVEDARHERAMDFVRSALECYLSDLRTTTSEIGKSFALEKETREVLRVLEIPSVAKGQTGLFDPYIIRTNPPEGGKVKVFVSYKAEPDFPLAEKIKSFFEKNGVDAFVAGSDIQLGEDWPPIIEQELRNCTALIPIVTKEFANSGWANQEVGVAFGLNKKIIPIKKSGSRIGILYQKQGVDLIDDNSVEQAVLEIIDRLKQPNSGS